MSKPQDNQVDTPTPAASADPDRPQTRWSQLKDNPWVWQRRFGPAFWTITGVMSLILNIILIIALFFLMQELFNIKKLVSDQLIGGLYDNFVKMEQAVIETTVTVETTIPVVNTITVNDNIPVQFTLPLDQRTNVTITEDTFIEGAIVNISTPFFSVNNAPADIVLPAGSTLPVALKMDVPVDQTIPINLDVPIDIEVPVVLKVPVAIPLNQTQLSEPFTGLQAVVGPYNDLLLSAPDSWAEVFCRTNGLFCIFYSESE